MMKILNLICLIFCIVSIVNAEDDQVQVTIKNGAIIGKKIWEQSIQLNQFLGIPYAEPPVGDLRFKRPKAFERKFNNDNGEEKLMALEWPNNCPQMLSEFNNISKYNNQILNENCLYLNIWSPKVLFKEDDEKQLRPVIFYIHGGGLFFGSSSQLLHNGKTLSALSDAVVVTINYRLSTLGLLYSEKMDSIKGNQALWDQTMALEWVQDNIRYFGGNPQMVTIIGESAGSWSVSAHILSPVSRNLFKNAYMMSGAITYQVSTPKQSEQLMLRGIRLLGCATETDQQINEEILNCLNKMDVQQLSMIPLISSIIRPYVVVDGQFFPEHPIKMLKNGNFKKNFNLLVSTMEDECSGLLDVISEQMQDPELKAKFSNSQPEPIDFDEAKKFLQKFVKSVVTKTSKNDDETMSKIYFHGINSNLVPEDLLRKTVGIAFGDMWLGCPTIEFAKKIFMNDDSEQKTNVYQLYNSYKLGFIKDFCNEWAGSCHADDLHYLFGLPFQHPGKYLQRERDISWELISILKSFIRNGHPNQTEQPEWQSFFLNRNDDNEDGKKSTQLIAPYYHLSNQYRTYKSYGLNLKQTECKFWNKFNYNDYQQQQQH